MSDYEGLMTLASVYAALIGFFLIARAVSETFATISLGVGLMTGAFWTLAWVTRRPKAKGG